MYYNECPMCGAALDPGEKCNDCAEREKRIHILENRIKENVQISKNGQFCFNFCTGK